MLDEDAPFQVGLFTDVTAIEKRERLDVAIEEIRKRFGKHAIRNAVLCQDLKLPPDKEVELIMPTGMIG